MIPTTAKALHRFTPESARNLPVPPVYLLTVPTKRLRALYDRELTANGVRPFSRGQILARIREVIELLNAENQAELLELLDRVERADEDAPLTEAEQRDWRSLERRLQAIDPDLQQMQAANRYYLQMAPIVAARLFIAGWENRQEAFSRGADGLMPEALVEGIDDTELMEIWNEILVLIRPSETDAKNSASPQPSPQGQEISTAASAPLTDQPGNSSASDSTATQN